MPDTEQEIGQAPLEHQPIVETYTLSELSEKLSEDPDAPPYYVVDVVRDPRTKHKLIDPRSELTENIVRHMYENWNLSRETVVRVTRSLDFFDDGDEKRTIGYYLSMFHRYLSTIFTKDKTSYKAEVQGLVTNAVELLDSLFNYDNIDSVRISPEILRPFTSYYDHLANTAIYWLATFAAINKKLELAPGSIEVWRSRDKESLRQLAGGLYGELPKNLVSFYDIYSRDPDIDDANKKGDLSLVISGFFGALFHDLGLLSQPRIIISQEGKIDDLLMKHMDESNALLKNKLSILYDERPLTRSIIKHHHERLDGTGYPKKLKTPHLFAQMLGVCDTYDEFGSRFVRGKIIRYLARAAGRQYEGDIVRAFFSILQPYIAGEHVQVYEGKGGEPVMSAEIINVNNRFKPIIRITETHTSSFAHHKGEAIDLGADENITFFV